MLNKKSPPHRLTEDKREIEDFPKPSPLSHKRGLKDEYIVIGNFNGLKTKSKCVEGWASFIRKPLSEIVDRTSNPDYSYSS